MTTSARAKRATDRHHRCRGTGACALALGMPRAKGDPMPGARQSSPQDAADEASSDHGNLHVAPSPIPTMVVDAFFQSRTKGDRGSPRVSPSRQLWF